MVWFRGISPGAETRKIVGARSDRLNAIVSRDGKMAWDRNSTCMRGITETWVWLALARRDRHGSLGAGWGW